MTRLNLSMKLGQTSTPIGVGVSVNPVEGRDAMSRLRTPLAMESPQI